MTQNKYKRAAEILTEPESHSLRNVETAKNLAIDLLERMARGELVELETGCQHEDVDWQPIPSMPDFVHLVCKICHKALK
jgi:hypothetical protein